MYKLLAVFFIVLLSCKSKSILVEEPPLDNPENSVEELYEIPDYTSPEDEEMEYRILDELTVTAPRGFTLPPYNPSSTRYFDLLHTRLDIRFDWVNELVIGSAELDLVPYFYPQNSLKLDAKNFDILNLMLTGGEELSYSYNNEQISIELDKVYARFDTVKLTIDYIAKPSSGDAGGSAAITSEKGLFFINPRGEELNKPQQIWTQGETENNSRWFPTIDKPNENSTQELRVTIDNRYITLSNGTLVSSVVHADSTRTDYWKMEKPHAPYLFMLAIGEYAVVRDKWGSVDVNYYVEPKYAADAKEIFRHTPEMLAFFSDILDYPYPWNKFSQVITRDYVSGAMENTTAVIYGDFIQKTRRELIDNGNDFIVAHEMFHHWFGNLVTCESWANLTLQEGMANYSEYLWQEYKYGTDAAGYQRMNEIFGYLASIQQGGTHPLIYFGYNDKEDMFDGHSYNKGGLVIHMLRKHLGDDAFYAALNKYLSDNAYTAVEADELRMAFEDVSGEDLNWFFDQWYFDEGHPELEISHDYDSTARQLILSINQIQEPESNAAIFQLPVTVSVYDEKGEETLFDIWLDEREEEINLDYANRPALVIFDRDDVLLYEKEEKKTNEEYARQYSWSETFRHRYEAISRLGFQAVAQPTIIKALGDNHFAIRAMALENIRIKDNQELMAMVEKLATDDPHSTVRSAAIKKLRNQSTYEMGPLLDKVFNTEKAYPVISAALETLNRIDSKAALTRAATLQNESTNMLDAGIAAVFSASGDPAYLEYFESRLTSVNLFAVFNFYDAYYRILSEQEPSLILEKARALKDIGLNKGNNLYYRFVATNTINRLKNDLISRDNAISKNLGDMIIEIKLTETNELLQQRYQMF